MKLAAILEHLLSSLDSAASKAAETSPVLVFESLLVSVVLIILFANGSIRYKMRRLETEERQAVLQMPERLNLGRSATVKAVPLLRWLRIGRRK